MSENIEFISASNLPTTEAEEVDVLCVENGELKRKAGATLGGGGGSFTIKLTTENSTFDGAQFICTDNFDELAKALESGCHANVVFSEGAIDERSPAMCMSIITWMFMEGALVCVGLLGSPVQITFTNGTYIPTI